MPVFSLIKLKKAEIEKHRTIAKIHVSWNAARTLLLEMVEKNAGDYDPVFSNGRDRLLGCAMEVHVHQVEDFWFEDVNGQKIMASGRLTAL